MAEQIKNFLYLNRRAPMAAPSMPGSRWKWFSLVRHSTRR